MERDKKIIELLKGRCGTWSIVVLENGMELKVFDIAWGYDIGDEWAHITTNKSPGPVEGVPIDYFSTEHIRKIMDDRRNVLFNR